MRCNSLALAAAVLLAPLTVRAQDIALGPGFSPDPQTLSGYSGGDASASWITRGCPGFIPAVPQHRLALPGGIAFLRVWAHTEGDATLLVVAPNGAVFCADDTWGHDPGVDIQAAMPGSYDVYVGTYRAGESRPYTLGFTASTDGEPVHGPVADPVAPNVVGGIVASVPPLVFPLAPGFAPDPGYLRGVVTGSQDARAMGTGCAGFVGTMPSQILSLRRPMERLRLWAHAHGDSTLVVRAPGGRVLCADDNFARDPMLEVLHLPAGEYEVFVGTREQGTVLPYALGLSERETASPAMLGTWFPASVTNAGGETPTTPAGPLLVSPGQTALTATGTSGGPRSALALGRACGGFIAASANHVVRVGATIPFLRAYVTATTDTTLAIVGPDGVTHCADDTYGPNPGVDLHRVLPGDYRVFVGSYDPGVRDRYQLTITQSPSQHP